MAGAGEPWSITAISKQTGVPISTVHREIQALDESGLVLSQRIGITRLVAVNPDSPFVEDLRNLLVKAFGPVDRLTALIDGVGGVKAAFIFGSWARRYSGEPGAPPRDVDLLVVGEPNMKELYRVARRAERELGQEINPVVITEAEWKRPKALIKRIHDGPLIALNLAHAA